MSDLSPNALVIFKTHPAKVISTGEKIEIKLSNGAGKKVRPKDLILLHPGPVSDLSQLDLGIGNISDTRELMEGEAFALAEVAELLYENFSPAAAWSCWKLLEDGVYFRGSLETMEALSAHESEEIIATRKAAEKKKEQWKESIERIKKGVVTPEETTIINEIKQLALAQSTESKAMHDLKIEQSSEKAHQLLLDLGEWDEYFNPYPQRYNLPSEQPEAEVPPLPQEDRRDLTYLSSFAIDDEGSTDPDDALSWDNGTLWVHIADVAALIPADSPLDTIARQRGSNLYLPEGCVPMLPKSVTTTLALGLNETSPALSFGITLDDNAHISGVEIVPSTIKVTRLSYREADSLLDTDEFIPITAITHRYDQKRKENGSSSITLPEVKISLSDKKVSIRTLAPLKSRKLVTNAMLMAGEAVAQFCTENTIPLPYITQSPPSEQQEGDDMATQLSNIKKFNRSEIKSAPSLHAGLGLDAYTRTTSPLRRYTDLLVHQQLRSFIRGTDCLSEEEVISRYSESDIPARDVTKAERESNKHWTLVYLMQNKNWTGEGVLVEKWESRGTWILPELALQTKIRLSQDMPLNATAQLSIGKISLPDKMSVFRFMNK